MELGNHIKQRWTVTCPRCGPLYQIRATKPELDAHLAASCVDCRKTGLDAYQLNARPSF